VAFAGAAKTHGGLASNTSITVEYENIIRLIYKKKTSIADKNHRCRMFPYGLGIKYDGSVYPCAVARDYGVLYMGNITNRSLHDAIQDFMSSENAKIINEYVSNDISECNNCFSKEVCNRGCRVRAYKFYSKLSAPDPFCCKIFNNDFPDIPMNCLFWGEK